MFKKLFCRHKLVLVSLNGSLTGPHLWRCTKCGKLFTYKAGKGRCR